MGILMGWPVGGGGVHRAGSRLARRWVLGAACALAVLASLPAGVASAATTATATFSSPGGYAFTVPPSVTGIAVTAVGAAGGDCIFGTFGGGRGAAVSATFAVSPGERLVVGVGGPGGNASACGQGGAGGAGGIGGGGTGGDVATGNGNARHPGGGGGGASLVGTASSSPGFAGLLVVAGGGGGGNGYATGGDSGSPGGQNFDCGDCGKGGPGTLTSGGAGGHVAGTPDVDGAAGSFGLGGSGAACPPAYANTDCIGGGGGGGGYYGGGGGGSVTAAGGGGGGSSFVGARAANVSIALSSTASAVSMTYAAPAADVSASAMHFGTQAPGTAGPAQTLTVTNKGSAPLVVSGVLLGGADPGDFLLGDRCQQPVPAGSSCQVGVRFHPQATGARSASLTLLTNAASAPAAVTLSGGISARSQRPAGKVELLTCKPVVAATVGNVRRGAPRTPETCTGKLVRGAVKFTATGSSTRATIVRGHVVFASGASVPTGHGGFELVLTVRRALKRGGYTLILRYRQHHRWVIAGRRRVIVP
jgi:hypothetical protein